MGQVQVGQAVAVFHSGSGSGSSSMPGSDESLFEQQPALEKKSTKFDRSEVDYSSSAEGFRLDDAEVLEDSSLEDSNDNAFNGQNAIIEASSDSTSVAQGGEIVFKDNPDAVSIHCSVCHRTACNPSFLSVLFPLLPLVALISPTTSIDPTFAGEQAKLLERLRGPINPCFVRSGDLPATASAIQDNPKALKLP